MTKFDFIKEVSNFFSELKMRELNKNTASIYLDTTGDTLEIEFDNERFPTKYTYDDVYVAITDNIDEFTTSYKKLENDLMSPELEELFSPTNYNASRRKRRNLRIATNISNRAKAVCDYIGALNAK